MIELTPYLAGIAAAYTILFIGTLSPGPAVALLVGTAAHQGRVPALAVTLGISFGSMSINILTLLGVGLLLSQAAWAMSALKILGVAYLLYLAYGSFRKAINPPSIKPINSAYRTLVRQFVTGYLLQVTNPKAIAFWLAISAVGAVDGAGIQIILLFVAGGWLISFLGHAIWAVALSARPIRELYMSGRRWIEATLGCFFIFIAYKLATSDEV